MAETEIVLGFDDDTPEEFEAVCVHRGLDFQLVALEALRAITKAMEAGACLGETIEVIYALATHRGAPARPDRACDHRPLGFNKAGVELITAITYAMKFGVEHKRILDTIDMITGLMELMNTGVSPDELLRAMKEFAATGSTATATATAQ